MSATTVTLSGKRFVILPEAEYRRLREGRSQKLAGDEWGLPPLPAKLPSGNYPAVEYARALAARDLIRTRRRLGLSQSDLARRAGVRVETLNRIERAKNHPRPRRHAKTRRRAEPLGAQSQEKLLNRGLRGWRRRLGTDPCARFAATRSGAILGSGGRNSLLSQPRQNERDTLSQPHSRHRR